MSGSRHEWLDDETAERLLNGEPADSGRRRAAGHTHPRQDAGHARPDAGSARAAEAGSIPQAGARRPTVERSFSEPLFTECPSVERRPPDDAAGEPLADDVPSVQGLPTPHGAVPADCPIVPADRCGASAAAPSTAPLPLPVPVSVPASAAWTVGGEADDGYRALAALLGAAASPAVDPEREEAAVAAFRSARAAAVTDGTRKSPLRRNGLRVVDDLRFVERLRTRSTRVLLGSVVAATALASGVAAAAVGVIPTPFAGDLYNPAPHATGRHSHPATPPESPQLPEPAGSVSATPAGPAPFRTADRPGSGLPGAGPRPTGDDSPALSAGGARSTGHPCDRHFPTAAPTSLPTTWPSSVPGASCQGTGGSSRPPGLASPTPSAPPTLPIAPRDLLPPAGSCCPASPTAPPTSPSTTPSPAAPVPSATPTAGMDTTGDPLPAPSAAPPTPCADPSAPATPDAAPGATPQASGVASDSADPAGAPAPVACAPGAPPTPGPSDPAAPDTPNLGGAATGAPDDVAGTPGS